MSTGWATNDVLRQERLNRDWIVARLMMPVYDVDDALSGTVDANVITPDDVINSITTHYTVGATARGLAWLNVVNWDGSLRNVVLHVVPNGGGPDYTTVVFQRNMPPSSYARIGPIVLTAGATIQSSSDTATADKVILRGEVLELEANPAGMTITGARVGATTTNVALYTCPSVTHALASIMITNTDTSPRDTAIYIDRGGAGLVTKDGVMRRLMPGQTSLCTEWHVLNTGDVVYVYGEANNVVGARISVVEFA